MKGGSPNGDFCDSKSDSAGQMEVPSRLSAFAGDGRSNLSTGFHFYSKMCNANLTHHVPTDDTGPDMPPFFAQVDRLHSTPVTNMFAMSMWHIRLSARSEFIAWKQVGVGN